MLLSDFIFLTCSGIFIMTLASMLFCLCIKLRDMALKQYILDLAKCKGIKLDPEKLDRKPVCQSPHASENCTIIIPDVAIIL